MSLGKLPAMKGLVSASHGKRRFRSDLSAEMISPPLGDFRHTMHVGRGGDVFGDTSFLSNYGGQTHDDGPGHPDSPSGSKTTRFLSRTLRHVRKRPPARLRGGSRDLSSPPPSVSPIIKNAISLPHLHLDAPDGGLQRARLPTSASSPVDSLFSYGLHSGFLTLPRFSRLDQNFTEPSETFCADYRRSSLPGNSDTSMTRSDSLTSFTVDLGPSLMTEVLGLIDSSRSLFRSSQHWDMEEEEEPSFCASDGSPREDEEDEDPGIQTTADASLRGPIRAEVGIEPQRFQQAANMLARHFGGGSLLKEQQRDEKHHRSSSFRHRRALYTFTDAEEEITV